MRYKNKLGNRILLFVVVTFIIVIAVITTVVLGQVSRYNDNSSKNQANRGVNGLKDKVTELQTLSGVYANMAAADEKILAAFETDESGKMKESLAVLLTISGVDFMILTDEKGKTIANEGIKVSRNDFSANDNYANALKGTIVTTAESEIVSRLTVITIVPVKNDENKIVGTMTAGYVLDNTNIVDGVKKLYDTDVTIFSGDVRINTTIALDGKRQIGTTLSAAVAEKVIHQGITYNGEAEILGSQYICAYLPLKNSNDSVIGVLFAGQPLTEVKALINNTIIITLSISIFAIVVIILELIIYLGKIITKPLQQVMAASQEIANGNLNITVDVQSKNEVGALAEAFRVMAGKLRLLLGKVNESAAQISNSSREIAASSTSLSQGTVEQAASVEQLSASAEHIYTMTKSNSETAENVSKLSVTAKSKCNEGNERMQNLLAAMDEINQSSGKISKIIKVIDDIAFQTNILALNAAVEAAQAGQHGKGFAVVADNVKQLAHRSQNAAREIADMIQDSISKSNNGTEIAAVTAQNIEEILSNINEMDSLITTISASSAEQTAGISQINSGIQQISSVLQTNSAMSEESSAASVEMSSQAQILKEQVSLFKF